MTAAPSPHDLARAAPLAQTPETPVAFSGLFGWFAPGLGRRGVVLCGTPGFEGLAAHRAWRGLARGIAAMGCATLRFDLPGEGDSTDEGADRLASRLDAVRRAVRHLRESGLDEVVLIGLRLGATLAALAAEDAGVDYLALLAPFATGRAYLREMTMQARTVGRLPDGRPLPQEPGIAAVGGFRLEPALAADLGTVDLAAAARPPAPRILLLGPDPAGLAARYRGLGAEVEAAPLPGLTALIANPLLSAPPTEAFAAVTAFATAGLRPALAPPRAAPPVARLAGPGWREEAVRVGDGLFGLVCRPQGGATGRPAVLFVNAGTNVHSGWGRGTTRLARRLAAAGVASLRMDVAGIGDSPDRADGTSPIYNIDAVADVRAGLDRLAGEGPLVVVAACSGAYLAFNAACRDERVRGALLVNHFRFDWRPDDSLDEVLHGGARSANAYASLLRRGDTWRRLVRGEIHVAAIARTLARRAGGPVLRRLKRLATFARGATVPQRVAAIRRRGAILRFVYSEGDVGLPEYQEHLGRDPARHLGQAARMLPDADHDLSTPAAQAALADALDALIAEVEAAA